MKNNKEMNWSRLLIKDEIYILKILIFKIFLYYYQSVNQILSAKNVTTLFQYETILLALSNFDISLQTLRHSGICLIGYIKSGLHELLVNYLLFLFVMVNVLLIFIFSYFSNINWFKFCG
eukprot:348778_1